MRRRDRHRSKPENSFKKSKTPEFTAEYRGGNLVSLSEKQKEKIHSGVVKILTEIGLSGAPEFIVSLMTNNGAKLKNERILLSENLIEKCLSSCKRNLTLFDQKQFCF